MDCITGQKLHAGLRKKVRQIENQRGGGLGVILLGMASMLLVFAVFLNIADYSIYTYKRNAISKAIDYAVTAAVQDIDITKSQDALADGFDESTGKRLTEGIEIDINKAEQTFISVFNSNCNQGKAEFSSNLLICATSVLDNKLSYKIKTIPSGIFTGTVDTPSLIEDRLNEAINSCWPDSDDTGRVFVNGNPKTNMIENGTYLFAFIKDIEITGIFTERKLTLSSFAGAKLDRASEGFE